MQTHAVVNPRRRMGCVQPCMHARACVAAAHAACAPPCCAAARLRSRQRPSTPAALPLPPGRWGPRHGRRWPAELHALPHAWPWPLLLAQLLRLVRQQQQQQGPHACATSGCGRQPPPPRLALLVMGRGLPGWRGQPGAPASRMVGAPGKARTRGLVLPAPPAGAWLVLVAFLLMCVWMRVPAAERRKRLRPASGIQEVASALLSFAFNAPMRTICARRRSAFTAVCACTPHTRPSFFIIS